MTKTTQLIPVVGTGAAAAMIFNILPVFIGQAAESFGLDDSAAGWLATTYLAGFGISSVTATFWLHRLGQRSLGRGLFLASAVLLMAGGTVESYAPMAVVLFAVGAFLGGLYTLSFMLAVEHPDATRAVGVKLGGEVALGASLLALMPTVVYPAYGFAGTLATLAILLLVLAPCTQMLGAGTLPIRPQSMENSRKSHRFPAVLALGALFVFTVGQASVWSFVERAGARADFDAAAIGGILSVAVLLGGAGSLLAGLLSDRLGKAIPMFGAALLYTLAMGLFFALGTHLWAYAGAINLFFFCWLFALPYFISSIAHIDESGHGTLLVTACLAFGSMLGPAIGGNLLAHGDFRILYLSGATLTLFAYAIVLGVVRARPQLRVEE